MPTERKRAKMESSESGFASVLASGRPKNFGKGSRMQLVPSSLEKSSVRRLLVPFMFTVVTSLA